MSVSFFSAFLHLIPRFVHFTFRFIAFLFRPAV